MEKMKIGNRIAQLRTKQNMTQLELAEKLYVTDRAISKWETENSYPDISLLPQIADIFNVSIDYLLRGTPMAKQQLKIVNAWNQGENKLNSDYLDKGWKVVDMQLAGDGKGGCLCAVVLEKEFFEEKLAE